MDQVSSLLSLQQQTKYTMNVDVSQGELVVGGSSKKIYRATWLNGARSPKSIVLVEMKGDEANREAMLCLTLDHPHIVHTYGLVKPALSTQAHDTLLLLQEYAADGDLGNMLSRRIFIPSKEVLIEIFIQIASAMIYLSKNKHVHGDLACRNILVFQSHPEHPKQNCVKLIDFGLTQNDRNSSSTKPRIFPVRYAAPEILRSQGQSGYSEQSDAYSFAVLMWEACSGLVEIPFAHINDDEEVSRRKISGEKLARPDKCSDPQWNLMLQCWSVEPRHRPTFQETSNRLKQIQTPHTYLSPLQNSTIPLREVLYEPLSSSHTPRINVSNSQPRARVNGSRQNLSGNSRNERRPLSGARPSFGDVRGKNNNPFVSNPRLDLAHRLSRDSSPQTTHQAKDLSDAIDDSGDELWGVRPSAPVEQKVTTPAWPRREPNPRLFNTSVTRVQLPCEVCKQLIDQSQLQQHQTQCLAKDCSRVEAKRRKLQQEQLNNEKAPCDYCGRTILLNALEHHQNTCSANPRNLAATLPRVPSTLNFHATDEPATVAASTTKPEPPSIFRRFLIRIGFAKAP